MIKVAIVEYNKTVRESLGTIVDLASDCQCVGGWGTSAEAIKSLRRQVPDVVLIDVQLPNVSGIECVAQIKMRLPAVQILMLTVYEDPDYIFRALRAGACGYLLKRSTPQQIITTIRDVYQGGTPMTSEIARRIMAQFRDLVSNVNEAENLSASERDVLQSVAQGLNTKGIAARQSMTVDAVRGQFKDIYHKLHEHSRKQDGNGKPSEARGQVQCEPSVPSCL